MTKKKLNLKNKAVRTLHKLGEKHFIDGIECETRFINLDTAWVFPTTDDKDEPGINSALAYATISPYGKINLL